MATYTISTRTVTKGMLGTAKSTKEIVIILCDGEWYADVPADADASEIVNHLNKQAAEAAAYRAQIETGIGYQSTEDLSEAGAVDVTERVVASHDIELSIDTEYAEAFAAWLRARGHAVRIGRSTGSYIDGAWTSADASAAETMSALWEAFCAE